MKTVKLTKEQQELFNAKVKRYRGLKKMIDTFSQDLLESYEKMWEYVNKLADGKEVLKIDHSKKNNSIVLK